MQPEISLPEAEERAQHLSAIQSLSEQHHLPAADVAALYERELASLRRDALITNYLSIFVSRRVVEALRALGVPPASTSNPTVQ
jgi:hypothetical protein